MKPGMATATKAPRQPQWEEPTIPPIQAAIRPPMQGAVDMIAIAIGSLSLGKKSATSELPGAGDTEPPIPNPTRARTSCRTFCANPPRVVRTLQNATPMEMIASRPFRSARRATGMERSEPSRVTTMPAISPIAVSDTWKSFLICSSTTLTIWTLANCSAHTSVRRTST